MYKNSLFHSTHFLLIRKIQDTGFSPCIETVILDDVGGLLYLQALFYSLVVPPCFIKSTT